MSDNVTKFPEKPKAELLVGPFTEYRVLVEGRIVPKLTGHPDQTFGDGISLVVDNRFSIWVEKERAPDVAWLIAQAMAVTAGYSHFAADEKAGPFARIACEVGPDLSTQK